MESTWTSPWNPYGMHDSMDIPYGFHTGYGMKKWLGCQPKNSPYGFHGMGMESTHSKWNPYCRKNPWSLIMYIMWIMTGPGYNALQPKRNDYNITIWSYNRKVDPYKTPTQTYKITWHIKMQQSRIEPKTLRLVWSSHEDYKFVVTHTIRLHSGIRNFPRPTIYLVFKPPLQQHYLYALDGIWYHFQLNMIKIIWVTL